MAENLGKRPSKGILKTSSSFEKPDAPKRKQKETKWDEMNIIATLHPPDKEYGHMKIEEPKTPYNWVDEDAMADELDASVLAEKNKYQLVLLYVTGKSVNRIMKGRTRCSGNLQVLFRSRIRLEATKPPKSIEEDSEEEDEESAEESEEETEEIRAKRVAFESKRKAHYNEYYAVKLARKLMEEDQAADDDSEQDDNVEMQETDSQQVTENNESNSNMNCVTISAATGHCS